MKVVRQNPLTASTVSLGSIDFGSVFSLPEIPAYINQVYRRIWKSRVEGPLLFILTTGYSDSLDDGVVKSKIHNGTKRLLATNVETGTTLGLNRDTPVVSVAVELRIL